MLSMVCPNAVKKLDERPNQKSEFRSQNPEF